MAHKGQTETLDEIWTGDRLGRREDGALVAVFIESVGENFVSRDDMRAFTIAIDAPYGVGKTFFLRRLAQQLSAHHPVAYVDAWSDDIVDEPLTALVATLVDALAPIRQKKVSDAIDRVVRTSGEILKIGAAGLAKRALGLAITTGSAELVEHVFEEMNDAGQAAASNVLGGAGVDALGAVEGAAANAAPNKIMADRVAAFQAGRRAIRELKSRLASLVALLKAGSLKAPIVIVIDELDRCRPTYAIKLLEEIKHLFDVEGLVFVLGTNLDQLAHSVSGTYGPNFDGAAYLRKFIGRRYRLREPELSDLFADLLAKSPGMERKLDVPATRFGDRSLGLSIAQVLARYMAAYGISTRDSFHIFDRLQICASLTGQLPLIVPYLVPLLAAEIQGRPRGELPEVRAAVALGFEHRYWDGQNHGAQEIGIERAAKEAKAAASISLAEMRRRTRSDHGFSLAEQMIFPARDTALQSRIELADPANYPDLLSAIGRFEKAERA